MNYLKILTFALKNKKTREIINLRFQKFADRGKKKRKKEYDKLAIDSNNALSKIFPDKKISLEIPKKLEEHLNFFKNVNESKEYPSQENPYPINFGLDKFFGRFVYTLCKHSQLDLVVETGVANGFSSSYFLSALAESNKGRLISIDDTFLPWHSKQKIGRAIPEFLREQFSLIIGDASKELQKLIQKEISIDIFLHDSAHTYQNMTNEFCIVWPKIRKGGFLLSDDVSDHDAFLDFSDEVNRQPIIISGKEYGGHFGIIQK